MSVFGSITESISRLVRDSSLFNTINTRTVEIHFQKSPGRKEGDPRGIEALEFQVTASGAVIQKGASDKDGVIKMRVRGSTSTLQIMDAGTVVAEYEVTIRTDAVEAKDNITGIQKRLRILGYHLGHDGTEKIGITNSLNVETDRSLLEFQGDKKARMTGRIPPPLQDQLVTDAGV